MKEVLSANAGLSAGISFDVTSAGSTKSAALAVGERYLISCSAATHLRLGASTSAAVTTDLLLPATVTLELEPWGTANYLHGITPSGTTSTVYLSKRRSY